MRAMAAVLLLGALACGGRGGDGSVRPQDCTGQQVLIVTNDWNEAVEVYASMQGQAMAQTLGTVLAGSRAEFTLQPGTRSAAVRPARAIQPSYTPQGMRQLVRLRTVCR
jgi:hypothetical protein